MRLDCSRNPPVSPSASHPLWQRGLWSWLAYSVGQPMGKSLLSPADPPRQPGVREARAAAHSQAAPDALVGKAVSAFSPRPDNSGFGLQRKRSTAKGLPARDGSERRQIPLPFFGADEGSSTLCKQRVS